jgi:hypothetical protein
VPTLAPTNVGLVGAFHDEVRERDRRPSTRGVGQYREPTDHRLFHSEEWPRDDRKAPALGMFSPVNTRFG